MDTETTALKETKVRLTVYVHPSLVRTLKHGAVDDGSSLSEYVEKLLEDATEPPVYGWKNVPDDYVDPLEQEKAKHRPRKPTERQLSLLGADKLRAMGYEC